jgi:hypothetical protein
MKNGKWTGLGEYELDVTYLKATKTLSEKEINTIKKEKVIAKDLVTVENVETVKLVYVENEYRDTLIQVGMVVALLFVLLIVCVCVYIQRQMEFNDKVRRIVDDKDITNEKVAVN